MEWLIKLGAMLGRWGRVADRKLVVPVLEWFIAFFAARLEKRGQAVEGLAQWKQRALMDFRLWIADLPEDSVPDKTTGLPSPDLFTLLSEFAALRQEIRMQNREQNRSLRALNDACSAFGEAKEDFNNKSKAYETLITENAKALADLEERIKNAAEKNVATPFMGVRDALERGLAAAKNLAQAPPPKTSGWLRRAEPVVVTVDAEGVIEGYEMALRRCDRALAASGIQLVEAMGRTFDPELMRAVATRTVSQAEKGQVVEVQLNGFVRGQEVIRTAEVVVGE